MYSITYKASYTLFIGDLSVVCLVGQETHAERLLDCLLSSDTVRVVRNAMPTNFYRRSKITQSFFPATEDVSNIRDSALVRNQLGPVVKPFKDR